MVGPLRKAMESKGPASIEEGSGETSSAITFNEFI